MKEFSQEVKFRARPQDLYEVLTSEKHVSGFTQSKAVVDAKVGGSFSFFDGQISGTYLELIPNEKIVMAWRMKEWYVSFFTIKLMDITESFHT